MILSHLNETPGADLDASRIGFTDSARKSDKLRRFFPVKSIRILWLEGLPSVDADENASVGKSTPIRVLNSEKPSQVQYALHPSITSKLGILDNSGQQIRRLLKIDPTVLHLQIVIIFQTKYCMLFENTYPNPAVEAAGNDTASGSSSFALPPEGPNG
jgi:hypothetical protein